MLCTHSTLCVHCTVSILPPAPLQQRFASSYASANKGVVLDGSAPFLRLRARVQMQEPHMSHSDTLRPRAVHMLMAHVPQAAGWGAFSRNSHHRCGWTTLAAATVQCSAVELGAAAVDCNEHCELSSRSWSTSTCNDDCNILARAVILTSISSKPSSVSTHLVLLHCVVSSRHEASAHGGAVTGRCWSCAVCTVPFGTFNFPWGPSCG